jgi:HrpA-like RNA helicase
MGETGSGKTTKLPQFIRDARIIDSAIAITQVK